MSKSKWFSPSPPSSSSPRSSSSDGGSRRSSRLAPAECRARISASFQREQPSISVWRTVTPNCRAESERTGPQLVYLLGFGPPPCRVEWLYVCDPQAVIAEAEGRRAEREPLNPVTAGRESFCDLRCRSRARDIEKGPSARPAGFHQVALLSLATATNAPPMPCARLPARFEHLSGHRPRKTAQHERAGARPPTRRSISQQCSV